MAGGDIQDKLVSGSILSTIVRRNLDPSLPLNTHEEISQALERLRTVRLDREGITALQDLEMLNQTHSLYLQMNQIKKIENVEFLKNLRFLSLSGNRIQEIPNLLCLQKLRFLDLSHNLIQMLDTGGLPQTMLILSLIGNPCTKTQDYRQQVMEALPYLQELDGEAVRDTEGQESLSDIKEEDGSDSDDNSLPTEHSGVSSMGQEIIQRSYQRRNRAMREHEERLAELSDATDAQLLVSSRKDSCNAELQDSTSSRRKPLNSTLSKKLAQTPALFEKKTNDHQNNGISVSTSKPINKKQIPASSTQSGAQRSGLRFNMTATRKTVSDLLPKFQQTDMFSSGRTGGRATQNERPAISAPSTRRFQPAPTKKTIQPLPTHSTAMTCSSALNDKQPASASSSRKLQTAAPQKTAGSRQAAPKCTPSKF